MHSRAVARGDVRAPTLILSRALLPPFVVFLLGEGWWGALENQGRLGTFT